MAIQKQIEAKSPASLLEIGFVPSNTEDAPPEDRAKPSGESAGHAALIPDP
jgi:hypothetical protein